MQPRVLVVDDNEACRGALADVVAAAGFELVGVTNSGPAAILLLDELDPDVVLLDVRMPGMDGYETARLIRTASEDVLVVLVSATPVHGGDGVAPVVQKAAVSPWLLRELWRVRAPARGSHRLPGHAREGSLGNSPGSGDGTSRLL